MIRKIIALCIVLIAVSTAFTGCKKDPEPTPTDTPNVEKVEDAVEGAGDAAKEAVDEHAGHNHD
jgi:hypothetical protein